MFMYKKKGYSVSRCLPARFAARALLVDVRARFRVDEEDGEGRGSMKPGRGTIGVWPGSNGGAGTGAGVGTDWIPVICRERITASTAVTKSMHTLVGQ